MIEPNVVAACAQCLTEFDPGQGRGRKSRYCPDCRRERAKIGASIRAFGVMSAQMIEVSLLYGPELTRRRTAIVDRQEGRCAGCARKRRRLFIYEGPDGEAGLCIECFTKEVHGGDTRASQEDAEGVQRGEGRGQRRRRTA